MHVHTNNAMQLLEQMVSYRNLIKTSTRLLEID